MHLWNGRTGELLLTLTEHTDEVEALAFSTDEQQLATASFDGTIRVWHLPDGRLLHTFETIGNSVLAFSPDGTVLASGDGQEAGSHGLRLMSRIYLWDMQTGANVGRGEITHQKDAFIEHVCFSSSGRLLGNTDSEGGVTIWALKPMP